MEMSPVLLKDALTRLKRAQGQLGAVIAMIENGEDCRRVLTQLSAASSAIDRAGFKIIATGMRECQTARGRGEEPPMSEDELEKLFMSFS